MELMSLKYYSGIGETNTLQFGRNVFQAQRRQSRWLHCSRLLSPSIFTRQHFFRRGRLPNSGVCSGIESLHSFARNHCNLKAWTKTAENFYGDDDDTLLEPSHDNPLLFKDNHATVSNDNSAAKKFSWPLWLFGPFILLSTGVIPTLWLPFAPLFQGSATAGLLALAGLDGIFNLGASMFLLMTDSCARSWRQFRKSGSHVYYEIPPGYKGWTLFANSVGLLGPLVAYVASKMVFFGAEPALLPISAMIVPYLSLLLVHTCAELLVWQWQSPVWVILPLVYDCYSVLQLSRGLQLGQALSAPMWTIEAVKVLISWWVFVLAVQLMWIAWFVGNSQK